MRTAVQSGPVVGDDVGGDEPLVAVVRCREGEGQSGLQAVESFTLDLFLIAPDQVADIFADILVSAVLADICGNEITERTAEANGHGARQAAPS
jgi:hypothetical protein